MQGPCLVYCFLDLGFPIWMCQSLPVRHCHGEGVRVKCLMLGLHIVGTQPFGTNAATRLSGAEPRAGTPKA